MGKPLILLPLLLAALAGCVYLDDSLGGRRTREDCGRGTQDSARGQTGPARPADTVVFFSAVRFPDSYDWQRDTAYGSVPFEVLLYRDFVPVLSLASGPEACFTPDPDRHHILSGHLYTERHLDGQTLVGRDGTELFRFSGREFLLGLIEDGTDLYTLSQPGPGAGFSFRKNGSLLLERRDGDPFGSLSDPSYGPTGALYRDEGRIVFCYRASKGLLQAHFVVRDGTESRITDLPQSASILDLKSQDGRILCLPTPFGKLQMSEGSIWPEDGGFAVTAHFGLFRHTGWSGYIPAGAPAERRDLCPGEAFLYHSPEATFAVSADGTGTVRWYGQDREWESPEPCRFLSAGCAVALGDRLLLALTPKDARQGPQVHFGDRVESIRLNGYISRVGVEVRTPAR